MNYRDINAEVIDRWCGEGWVWGRPIPHETYLRALEGEWEVCLTPTKPVPREWFGELRGKKVLGLASGGGQQMPVFAALGAECTVMDYSARQCGSEKEVAAREGYDIRIVRADMTGRFPFEDGEFDMIFHPVSNCYVEDVYGVFRECARVLRKGGRLLGGYDIGINYVFDDREETVTHTLPYNPLKDERLYEEAVRNDWGIQFSHTIEEQLRGQLRAGFELLDIYEDTNGEGNLHEHNIPSFIAALCVKR